MTATYSSIATTTLSSAASTITFSSIPSTYTDLRLVVVAKHATLNNSLLYVRFNSDTATNYSIISLSAAANVGTERWNNSAYGYINWRSYLSSTEFILSNVNIFSYAGSTNKTYLTQVSSDFNGSGSIDNIVGLWRSTSAITSITVGSESGNLAIGTTATLYGIKAFA